MPTSTPTAPFASEGLLRTRGLMDATKLIATITLGNYVTGGVVLTAPRGMEGRALVACCVLNPLPDVTADVIFSWNGSASAPTIVGKVISTGAQLANALATYAATNIVVELTYAQ